MKKQINPDKEFLGNIRIHQSGRRTLAVVSATKGTAWITGVTLRKIDGVAGQRTDLNPEDN